MVRLLLPTFTPGQCPIPGLKWVRLKYFACQCPGAGISCMGLSDSDPPESDFRPVFSSFFVFILKRIV